MRRCSGSDGSAAIPLCIVAYGHQLLKCDVRSTSALPLKAEVYCSTANGRDGPGPGLVHIHTNKKPRLAPRALSFAAALSFETRRCATLLRMRAEKRLHSRNSQACADGRRARRSFARRPVPASDGTGVACGHRRCNSSLDCSSMSDKESRRPRYSCRCTSIPAGRD
jgi:hypothetical protein